MSDPKLNLVLLEANEESIDEQIKLLSCEPPDNREEPTNESPD